MPHIERLHDLLSEYASSQSSPSHSHSASDLLAFGVTSVQNAHQYYAWLVSNASRILLGNHGLNQVQAWLQQLRQEHGGLVEQFTGGNHWKCSADAAAAAAGPALTSLDRALRAARHNSHAAGCARMINDYMSCYVIANADVAKYGGAHARITCMTQYAAARMCYFTNEQSCLADPPSLFAPSAHSRVAVTRFGPMLFPSLDFYFRIGLGVCAPPPLTSIRVQRCK
jgi:hypothetical protein